VHVDVPIDLVRHRPEEAVPVPQDAVHVQALLSLDVGHELPLSRLLRKATDFPQIGAFKKEIRILGEICRGQVKQNNKGLQAVHSGICWRYNHFETRTYERK
jgi:hypothetical protein